MKVLKTNFLNVLLKRLISLLLVKMCANCYADLDYSVMRTAEKCMIYVYFSYFSIIFPRVNLNLTIFSNCIPINYITYVVQCCLQITFIADLNLESFFQSTYKIENILNNSLLKLFIFNF